MLQGLSTGQGHPRLAFGAASRDDKTITRQKGEKKGDGGTINWRVGEYIRVARHKQGSIQLVEFAPVSFISALKKTLHYGTRTF